ncbi:MAG: DUF2341 domain-containing protein [Pseudomonadota bacterium]
MYSSGSIWQWVVGSVLLIVCGATLAQDNTWWNDEWDYRKEVLFDMSPSGAGTETDVDDAAVLLRLSSANFGYFGNTLETGDDLRFVAADDITPLSFYIEKYDSVNEIALIWVRVPKLAVSGQIQSIFMYYGNEDAVAASDPKSVFDASTRLVLDFSAAGAPADRTAYNNSPLSSTVAPLAEGLIAGAARFEGAGSEIVLPPSPGLAVESEGGFTTSFWLRMPDPAIGEAAVLSMRGVEGEDLIRLGIRGGFVFATFNQPESAIEAVAVTQPLVPNTWAHIAMTVGIDEIQLYVNGDVVARTNTIARTFEGNWVIGDQVGLFAGDIDQFMLFATEQSPARVRFAARNEAPFGTVSIYGDDARNEGAGGHPNYFATTMRNVTTDGWVVIVILAVMFVISVWVMWIKARLLSKISKANQRFMSQYQNLGADPMGLDRIANTAANASGDFDPSTLFPLYSAGAVEVRKRLDQRGAAVGAASAGFTGETIAAVRASIDAAVIRQRQKLNSLMVLLTIAISGGPFLGLLGTVVGVMITFAAIAESGDVNVNSIAPGIAAALVATVAGLAVAIPALFGYNYLGSKIKDIDANTQVFADEYLTRIAEHYS